MSGSSWKHRSVFLLGLVLIAGIRFGTLWLGRESLNMDPDAYRALATSWHDTGTFGRINSEGAALPTAYRPPLYPWLLSWFASPSNPDANRRWIMGLHGILGLATCAITFAIGKRLHMPYSACWFATFAVACDPVLLRQSTLVMTETLATFLGAVLWWYWLQDEHDKPDGWSGRSLLLGIGMGLAVLCRPTVLAWMVLWWFVAIIGKRWRWAVASTLGLVVVIAPWAVRNAIQFGKPIATTTHGGYTLYLANNPILYRHWQSSVSREWDENMFHAQWRNERSQSPNQDEVAIDRVAQGLAWSTILDNPGTFLKGCVIRAGWLWALWPSPRQASRATQIAIAVWYGILFLLAIFGFRQLIRSGKPLRGWLPGLLLVASLTMVHSVYWSNMRMRAPAMPILALLAGVGLLRCFPEKTDTESTNRVM
jgi:hypothetical protein